MFVAGGNASVTGCKMCETAAPTNMATVCTLTGEYIAYNLITCYSSTNTRDWTDGITHQARGIIEYNTVVDATDCAIVVFRDWSGAPQDSVIRYNKIINVGEFRVWRTAYRCVARQRGHTEFRRLRLLRQ